MPVGRRGLLAGMLAGGVAAGFKGIAPTPEPIKESRPLLTVEEVRLIVADAIREAQVQGVLPAIGVDPLPTTSPYVYPVFGSMYYPLMQATYASFPSGSFSAYPIGPFTPKESI